MDHDLNALTTFLLVAEERSFRAAADRLGVTRSAVSQAIRRLENRVGLALVLRTTRSVGLTEAGAQLYADIAPPLADIRAAMEATHHLGAEPRGRLRLVVSSIAEGFLSGRLLTEYAEACPGVQLDVLVSDEEIDIVAHGFDAGVRLGEVVEQDMIALPVSGDQRQIAVCSPAYLALRDPPEHPRQLSAYRCIGWRSAPQAAPFRWEFTEAGRDFVVDVEPDVTTNDMALMIRMALSGAGITFGMEESFRPHLQRGELVPLLEDFCPPFPGFFLYYPSRRNIAPKLRCLIDLVRRSRSVEVAPDRPGGRA
ncbi:LysR family transcriptional regulator [Enterovirga rhinocerotis]|uniref:LysR family transcriptional regulator n=1 Tax=Enterovirga rhinocerotis TaxID=1339210 RepID=A0A4R7C838_9HYPH|nr:LysR family transcriptional regulator [Enterovirga rhinocerotis]TDR94511.1 LysR family transcriptional regulator [Enterovirga rhinocerotis]